jgi:hypothetical protein
MAASLFSITVCRNDVRVFPVMFAGHNMEEAQIDVSVFIFLDKDNDAL